MQHDLRGDEPDDVRRDASPDALHGLHGRTFGRIANVFHVKHHRGPRTTFLIPVIALLAIIGSACGYVASPEGWAAPVTDGARIYAQLDRGVLWAFSLDGATLQRAWRYPAEGDDIDFDAIYATPITANSVIYLISYGGDVVALNASDGRPLAAWGNAPVQLGARVVATPAFDGSRLFVATEHGELFAVEASNGSTSRLYQRDGRIWSAVAISGGVIYLGNMDARLVAAIDAATGDTLWEQSVAGAAVADLHVSDGLLLVGSLDRALHALDVGSAGNEQWSFSGDGWFMAAPTPVGGVVYAATLRGSVYAIDPTTGTERWRFTEADVAFRARPILVGDTLVAIGRKGEIFGLNAADGAMRWRQRIESVTIDADPLSLGSDVLVLTNKGDLVRIAPATGTTQRIPGAS